MADVPLNGINFQIKGETKNAVTSINQLQKALSKLEKIHIKDFGLKSASKEIKEFAKAIDKIDTTKLTAFSKGLSSISGVGRTFEKISKNPQEFAKSMELLTGYLESISKIDFSNLQTAADGLRAIAKSVNGIARGGESGSVEKTTSALSRLKDGITNLANSRVGKAFKNGMVYPIKQMLKPIKGVASGIKSMVSGLGRIAMYRLFRSIIKAITQALQEGTKNLYQYSKAIGGSFAAKMDMAATSMLYFKNSIAAAWSPLMNLLAPALDAIVDKVVAVINVINQLIALLSGQTGWTRAVKQATEYEEAVGGAGAAAKDAMRYLAPFDELNVLPDDKSGGGGGGAADNYSTMFEEMSTFSDFVQSIKDMIDAGDWQGVGTLIGEKINEVINSVNFSQIGTKVGEKINALFTTEYWTLKTINFQNIGAKVSEFLNSALAEIDFSNLGGIFAEKLTALPDIIVGAINTLDFGLVGQSIGDTIKGFFNGLSDWVQEVDWGTTASNLLTGIIDLIKGLDVGGIAESVLTLVSSVSSAIVSGLIGVIGDVVDALTNPDNWTLFWAWVQGLPAKIKNIGINAANALVEPITQAMNDFVENHPKLAEWLGLEDHIEFELIPNIPESELNAHYNAAKATIEAKSKEDPATLSAKAQWDNWKAQQTSLASQSVSSPVTVNAKANFTTGTYTSTGFPVDKRTINAKANFTASHYDNKSLPIDKRTINTKANFTSTEKYKGLDVDKRTINTKANFTSSDKSKLTDAQKLINTKANFTSSTNGLSSTPSLSANANMVNPKWNNNVTPTLDVYANIQTSHYSGTFAKGGAYYGGSWHDIPQAAGGGKFHGSLFWAGEAGPELVGHAGGRTEVLNKSQLASAMYASVVAAMQRAFGAMSVSVPAAVGASSEDNEEVMYRAFKRALEEADFAVDNTIEIDGYQIYDSVVRTNRREKARTGINPMMVGA